MRARRLGLALALAASMARADGELEQAKTLFNAGAQAFAAGQFPAAVQAFEESYKLTPKPAILFSMAQAERRQYFVDKRAEWLRRAIEHYRTYLEQVPKGGRRADAAQALAELEPVAARLEGQPAAPPVAAQAAETRLMVSTPTKGAEVWVDGQRASELPLIDVVKPGKHSLRVAAPGYFDETREVVAVQGGLVAVDVALRERPATLTIIAPRGAAVSLDGRPQGVTPLPPLEVAPGAHAVTLTLNGHHAHTEEIELSRGESRELRTGLSKTGQRKASYAVVAVGAGGLLAGGVLTYLALDRQKQAEDTLTTLETRNVDPHKLDAYDKDRSARDRYRTGAFIAYGAGAAVLTVGALMYAFDQPSVTAPRERPRPQAPVDGPKIEVGGLVLPGAAAATLRGSF
ncbi:MAG: PEGA domain-containing protein [Polyangiaceae bacterium]|nr:PEGA domain-containing protein [Polyangiaceae bacterium]